MKKVIFAIITLLISQASLASEADHFVAWGDEEGITQRSGEDPDRKNEALPQLKKLLTELEKKDPITALLHTGDFVRFDSSAKLYQEFLGDFLPRFYPTSGGDQEFYLGRYYEFLTTTPHLKDLYQKRAIKDQNGLEYYYHTLIKNTHLISLYNPDDYGEPEKKPQFIGQDIFKSKENQQYRWLENLLEQIRIKEKDRRPIIVLSHRPVFNNSKILVDLFDHYQVNLVLSGDVHVLGTKSYKNTTYIVTGMMGDRYIGGCEFINNYLIEKNEKLGKNENYIADYDFCLPDKQITREKRKPLVLNGDHYIDLKIGQDFLKYQAIDLETGKTLTEN